MPTTKGVDPERFLTSKDASVYERQLTFDVSKKTTQKIIFFS
jgi:hypothetical protein